MPKFRKKPVVIEAVQYRDEMWVDDQLPEGVVIAYWSGDEFVPEGDYPTVTTIHGAPVPIVDGDWIIPEPDGIHFYPCKPDIFEQTYERVEEESMP